jgi:hypothetical protein
MQPVQAEVMLGQLSMYLASGAREMPTSPPHPTLTQSHMVLYICKHFTKFVRRRLVNTTMEMIFSNSLRTAQIYCNMFCRVRGWRWKEPTPHAPLHYQVLYLISWAFYSLTGWNCLYETIDGLHEGLAASRSLSRQVQTIPAGPQHVAFHHNPGDIQTCKKKVFKKCYLSVKSGPRQQSHH